MQLPGSECVTKVLTQELDEDFHVSIFPKDTLVDPERTVQACKGSPLAGCFEDIRTPGA